jgi:ATP-binding cassette subfamily F protein 3
MIKIHNLTVEFGERALFDNISATILPYEKIGLVGRNGAGKSTLLKIIAGQQSYDSGTIEKSGGCSIAYMPQEVVLTSQDTVLHETLKTNPELYKAYTISKILEQKENHFTADEAAEYAHVLEVMQEHDFKNFYARAQEILSGLGFSQTMQQDGVSKLSGGWKMRIVLAQLLLKDADMYLFDEPTNHLDLPTKKWFLEFLQHTKKGYLLVCHDRYFLDKACSKTLEVFMGDLRVYHGNYTFFLEQKETKDADLRKKYLAQQKEIEEKEAVINRFRAKANKARMAQSMMKQLDKIERIELPPQPPVMNFHFKLEKTSGKQVLEANSLQFGYNPSNPLFSHISFRLDRGQKAALVAANGVGKTTLFNIIAGKLKQQRGSMNFGHNVEFALFDQDQQHVLTPELTIFEEIQSKTQASDQEIRGLLGAFLFSGDDVYKKTKVLSGGERNRVAMVKVLLSKANLLLLDEPTNHLDLESKEVLLKAMQSYQGTILFVSHDQDFINHLATDIFELTPNGLHQYAGNYDSFLYHKAQYEIKNSYPASKKSTNEDVSSSPTQKAYSTPHERSQIERQCKQLENKIAQLEKKLAGYVETMGSHEYGSLQYNQAVQKHSATQKEIDAITQEWEKAMESIS